MLQVLNEGLTQHLIMAGGIVPPTLSQGDNRLLGYIHWMGSHGRLARWERGRSFTAEDVLKRAGVKWIGRSSP